MIRIGDRVRVKFFKEKANSREFICSQLGTVELVWHDQVMVRIDGEKKLTTALNVNVELLLE